jgi:hypothetical protein
METSWVAKGKALETILGIEGSICCGLGVGFQESREAEWGSQRPTEHRGDEKSRTQDSCVPSPTERLLEA